MNTDPWHYPRTDLAEQVLGLFESGLSSTLTFFAPRRMGKTEFLCKDILPLAEDRKWKVFYFSFLDVGTSATFEFTKALSQFAEKAGSFAKTRNLLHKVGKISGEAVGIKAGIEFNESNQTSDNIKEMIAQLAAKNHVLLLMDEVQTLAQHPANGNFIAALRTALDIHKDNIKVIFTGSSQEGLRHMFSKANAPFFHFGQNLPFPELDKGFTDHLANMFEKATKRKLDKEKLWTLFQDMQKIPQLARSLVERMALNPDLPLENAKQQLMNEIFNDRAFANIWEHCSALERLLLCEIAAGNSGLFSNETKDQFAKKLGVSTLTISSIQSATRVLQRKELIGKYPDRGGYFIDDPNFKNWLLQTQNNA